MTDEDIRKFDGLMKSYYRNKSEKLEGANKFLWGIAIDLVTAIANSEGDGSGITDLKTFGQKRADDLRTMLEREMVP